MPLFRSISGGWLSALFLAGCRLAGRGKSHPRLIPGRKTSGFRGCSAPGTSSITCGRLFVCSLLVALAGGADAGRADEPVDVAARARQLFRRDNLVAWCIVPFDSKKREPEERAAMLESLGIRHFAYDWRQEHVPTFAEEWDALLRHRVALDAFWTLPPDLPASMAAMNERGFHPSFWVMIQAPEDLDQEAKVRHAAGRLRGVAEAAARGGCSVAVYNHGGWGGEPENMAAVCRAVDRPDVGIVYNQHHGHSHLPRFREALAEMLPHLRFLNLNGMTAEGDKQGKKILVLGQGDLDVALARTICESGYTGPIGILNHTGHDAEARLRDNLDGLDWITGELTGKPIPKPTPRTP
jgi:hypothetical protein